MNFNITELDLLRDAVNSRIQTLNSWQRDLCIMNDQWIKSGNMDEEIQENLDAIQEYQNQIDHLQPLFDKLSEMFYAAIK